MSSATGPFVHESQMRCVFGTSSAGRIQQPRLGHSGSVESHSRDWWKMYMYFNVAVWQGLKLVGNGAAGACWVTLSEKVLLHNVSAWWSWT